MANNSLKKAFFYENGSLSMGRIMFFTVFCILIVYWILGLIALHVNPEVTIKTPESLDVVFLSLMGYNLSIKAKGLIQTKLQQKLEPVKEFINNLENKL
jgi:hypothetical protein